MTMNIKCRTRQPSEPGFTGELGGIKLQFRFVLGDLVCPFRQYDFFACERLGGSGGHGSLRFKVDLTRTAG